MRPAFSVIFLTTLLGAAQGLFLTLYGTELIDLGNLSHADSQHFLTSGSAVALVLLVLGLGAFSPPGSPGTRLAVSGHVAHIVAVA